MDQITALFGPFIVIGTLIWIFITLLMKRAESQQRLMKRTESQQRIDSQVDTQVKRLYAQYGEEWVNNAGRSRIAMAIDEMLGPTPIRNSNVARAQRTLASAILETVLEHKGETICQQQAASREDSQARIVVDPMLAVDIVDTAEALAASAITNDLDGADDVDDFETDNIDDIDDVDDIDIDVDLDLD